MNHLSFILTMLRDVAGLMTAINVVLGIRRTIIARENASLDFVLGIVLLVLCWLLLYAGFRPDEWHAGIVAIWLYFSGRSLLENLGILRTRNSVFAPINEQQKKVYRSILGKRITDRIELAASRIATRQSLANERGVTVVDVLKEEHALDENDGSANRR